MIGEFPSHSPSFPRPLLFFARLANIYGLLASAANSTTAERRGGGGETAGPLIKPLSRPRSGSTAHTGGGEGETATARVPGKRGKEETFFTFRRGKGGAKGANWSNSTILQSTLERAPNTPEKTNDARLPLKSTKEQRRTENSPLSTGPLSCLSALALKKGWGGVIQAIRRWVKCKKKIPRKKMGGKHVRVDKKAPLLVLLPPLFLL